MYIVARYPQTIRNPKDSSKHNIGKNHAAWQNNEEVFCRKNLRTKDHTEASVILDVANEKVLKNRFNENMNFAELYAYYLSNYSNYINEWVNTQRHG